MYRRFDISKSLGLGDAMFDGFLSDPQRPSNYNVMEKHLTVAL